MLPLIDDHICETVVKRIPNDAVLRADLLERRRQRPQVRFRNCYGAAFWLGAVALLAGCGTGGGPTPVASKGSASGVAWEIVDVGQLASPDHQRMRWSYAIVLRETAGSAVMFERVERSSRSGIEMIGGAPRAEPFARTLA